MTEDNPHGTCFACSCNTLYDQKAQEQLCPPSSDDHDQSMFPASMLNLIPLAGAVQNKALSPTDSQWGQLTQCERLHSENPTQHSLHELDEMFALSDGKYAEDNAWGLLSTDSSVSDLFSRHGR